MFEGTVSSPGKLILSRSGKPDEEFLLRPGKLVVGRAQINDIVIEDGRISRSHVCLECTPDSCTLKDLGSANGSWVNGQRVSEVRLTHGDSIRLGDTLFQFEELAEEPSPELSVTKIALDGQGANETEDPSLPVEVSDTREPRLVIHTANGTSEVCLKDGPVKIGRDPRNEVVLNIAEASRRHAVVERRGDSFFIRDFASTNGTWVRGQKVSEQALEDGDTIRIGHVRMVFKKGFAPEELTILGIGELPSPSELANQRPVVIVPGLMGSELWAGSEKIWPNPKHLLTNPEIACLPGDCRLEAKSLVNEVVVLPNVIKLAQYNRLTEHLEEALGYERGKNLLEFPYDWRQDNRISAHKLKLAIDAWQERSPEARGPITLIAHSLGCLVSRYYLDCLGGKAKVKRIVFLGGPHYGAPKAVPTLMIGPDLLPFGLMNERIRRVLATFPSAYQILPTYPCVLDRNGRKVNVLTEDRWLSPSQRAMVQDADLFRRELGAHCSVPSVSIFGYGLKTITELTIKEEREGLWKKADILFELKGDSTLPERSTVLDGSEIHPVRQYHGSLYVDNDVKMRLKLELLRA